MRTLYFGKAINVALAEEMEKDSSVYILGHAAGSALLGRRPVVEIQFSDFLSVGFPMITQLIASYRWRSGTGLPIVIRAPYGGGKNGGPCLSPLPLSPFFYEPGLADV